MIDPLERKMATLMVIIDTALNSTDSSDDQLMLACAMLQRTTEIFDHIIGVEGRKTMFKSLIDEDV